jgi:molybdate transport system substrate-binding protein
MTKRLTAVLLAVLLAMVMAACGSSGDDGSTTAGGDGELVVSAASSLTGAFPIYARSFDGAVRFQFAGSDELAAQIRQGVKPDVFAAASPRFPEQLHAEGLVGRPVAFATNQLVLAVPQDSRIRSLADLAEPGTTIAIGSAEVPIGSYTHDVLDRLGSAQSQAILANVRSEEPDVKGIVGKLALGQADAGFVYLTDVKPVAARVASVAIPAWAQPKVRYEIAVVKASTNKAAARAWVKALRTNARERRLLQQAGFGLK